MKRLNTIEGEADTLRVRLPAHAIADLDAEAQRRGLNRSTIARERIAGPRIIHPDTTTNAGPE